MPDEFASSVHAYEAGLLTGLLAKWASTSGEKATVSPSVDGEGDYINRIVIDSGNHRFEIALLPDDDG